MQQQPNQAQQPQEEEVALVLPMSLMNMLLGVFQDANVPVKAAPAAVAILQRAQQQLGEAPVGQGSGEQSPGGKLSQEVTLN